MALRVLPGPVRHRRLRPTGEHPGADRRAGEVGDLSVVDVPYPFTEGVTVEQVKEALADNGLEAIGVTPEIYMRRYRMGAFTNPDPAVRADAIAS